MNAHKPHHGPTLAALLTFVLLAPATAQAALNTDSDTTAAKATLIRPLTMTMMSSLDFGPLIKGSLAAPVTVVLGPNGANWPSITSSNPGAVLPFGNVFDGAFNVLGEPNRLVQVSHPASILIKKGAGGSTATEMTINNFDVDVFQTGGGPELYNNATKQFSLPATGDVRLEVGGTLTVEDNDEHGAYSGTLTLTVTYL